ncbi:MAG: imidazoleglycerol-phosphate dehydratase HisB [Magnetococcales bacterium]|nr:imidazoleglycerol-phosphate dehydratase HisB [Magnetococcales bacterium]MBF0151995.1 imidazoleglycerol-phosphate dehydratase HisB [Magnetococcales bacterium]MBF0175002.1 imidazoleglycerol-phosphate dehydratase HisB [Magnetococcales bacterium]MBF0632892.1 imidazoleglycerol-phosphate dehydratase HisB [Magnetococcales bacterium]
MNRQATLQRKTAETSISVTLNLDGHGVSHMDTGIGFLNHMLDQLARHGLFDIEINARGDTHIDDHHTVEDVGIALGQAFRDALGARRGIVRFGTAHVPLDEALSRVVVDLSNRPGLIWKVRFPTQKVGTFDTELFKEWFTAFANNGGMTLHVENLYGDNSHHIIESCFKALALALRQGCAVDPARAMEVPSTKGTLSV